MKVAISASWSRPQRLKNESTKLRDQALILWSGSTDSKILDYQKTNHREYQTVITHTKKTLEYKTWHHPTTNSTLCRTPHLNNKENKNTNSVISRQYYNLTQLCPSEEKQTNKNSAQISTYIKLTQTHWTNHENERGSEVTQSCPTLCDAMDCSQPGSSVHEIL